MKKFNKMIYLLLSMFVLVFALTSCDIEGLINEYLPGVDLPFLGGETEKPTSDPTIVPTEEKCNHLFNDEYEFDSAYHWVKCQNCGELEYSPHELGEWKITKEPTTSSAGNERRECKICNFAENKTIPAIEQNVDTLRIEGTHNVSCGSDIGEFTYYGVYQAGDYFSLYFNDEKLTVENTSFCGNYLNDGKPNNENCFYSIDGFTIIYGGPDTSTFKITYYKDINNVEITMMNEDLPTIDEPILDSKGFVIHYYRPDGIYDNWNLWLWVNGFEGQGFEFNNAIDENGVSFKVDWSDFAFSYHFGFELGFLVRKGEWEMKDVEEDRFIKFADLTPDLEGYYNIYLNSGDLNIYYNSDYIKEENVPFNEEMFFLSSNNNYSFVEESKLIIDTDQDIAYIEVELKVGDSFILSSGSKEVMYNFNNTKVLAEFINSFKVYENEIECTKDGYYKIIIYNYSNLNSHLCEVQVNENPIITVDCSVAETLNLPLGSTVRITGYITKNGKYYDISDDTGSMRLYNYKGHIHEGLYGVAEGVLYDYNGLIELFPCEFTLLDNTQLSKIRLGNVIKDNTQLLSGLKVTFGTSNQLIGCKYNNYYNTSEFEYSGDWINVCTEVFTLIKENEYWLFESINGGYLSSLEKNELNILPDNNEYSRWNINIDSNGEALVSNLALNYFIKFNTSASPNRVTTGLQGSLVTPYLYIIEEYEEPIVDYEEFYLRGSFNDWLALDDYKLNYNRFTNRYSITLSLEIGAEFKIADNEWFKQYNAYNISSNFELKENFENIVAPYTGEYEIIINNYNLPEESCEIIYKASYDDVYLTSSIDNYNIKYENKFNQAYSKYNLIYDIEIEEGNTYLYSVKSLREVYYTNHLGTISEYVSFNDEIIDFKEPGSYRIIIENFKDLENIKIHILLNNIELSIEQALNYPDSALVKLNGEFIVEDSKMYITDGINKILLYNYSHVHSGEKGSIIGEIHTYNNEKEIVNGNITITETNYINKVEIYAPVMKNDDLINGLKIIIAYDNYVMTCQNTKYRNAVYIEDLYSMSNTCVGVFELVKAGDYWKIKDVIAGYLYLKDAGKNELYTGTVTDESDLWNISIDNGFVIIQNVLYPERYIQFNNAKFDRFTSYKNTQVNPNFYIVKEVVDFSQLRYVAIGDSITYGYSSITDGQATNGGYPELVK